MLDFLTKEQIKSLAPSEHAVRAADTLGKLSKWEWVGQNEEAIFGETLVGKKTITVQVNKRDLGMVCTCTTRVFPCSHVLGLMVLNLRADLPPLPEAPLEFRESVLVAPNRPSVSTTKKYLATVRAGLGDLALFLEDLVADGLMSAPERPKSFWTGIGDRMIDARLEGLGRAITKLPLLFKTENWTQEFLESLAKYQLLISAFENYDTLPSSIQGDLRTAIGWLAPIEIAEYVRGHWLVTGTEDDQLGRRSVRRTWLTETESGRHALITQTVLGKRKIDFRLVVGTIFKGEIGYLPSCTPLHGIIEKWEVGSERQPTVARGVPPCALLAGVADDYGEKLAQNRWLGDVAYWLDGVRVVRNKDTFFKRDSEGNALILDESTKVGWHLLTLSLVGDLTVFGRYDGTRFTPMAIWDEGRLLPCKLIRGLK